MTESNNANPQMGQGGAGAYNNFGTNAMGGFGMPN